MQNVCLHGYRQSACEITLNVPSLFLCLLLVNAISHASTTYLYTGNTYTSIDINQSPPAGTYDTGMRVTGSFTVASPLTASAFPVDIKGLVTSFSFSDGRYAFTEATTTLVDQFQVRVDNAGEVINWVIWLVDLSGANVGEKQARLQSSNFGIFGAADIAKLFECNNAGCTNLSVDQATAANPGSWSTAVIPLPATAWLLGTGLGLLGWRRARRN